MYLIWDMLKFFETRRRFADYKGSTKGLKITALFAAITVGIAFLYLFLLDNVAWEWDVTQNRISLDFWFILVYIGHTFFYRWFKRTPEVDDIRTH
jgi:hypothetical protein